MQELSIVLMIVSIVGTNGQENGMERKGTGDLNLEVVYERNFEEPVIDVIFDTATVTIEEARRMGWKEEAFTEDEVKRGKVLVSYPKVVLVGGEEGEGYWGWYIPPKGLPRRIKMVRFYSKNGSIIKELQVGKDSIEYVYISPQKKFFVVSKIPWEDAPDHTGGILYNSQGEKIWQIKNRVSPICVSDGGSTVAVYPDWQVPPEPGGDFYLYDSTGKLIAAVENPDPTEVFPVFARYSQDGHFVLLCYSGETVPPTIFFLIDEKGEILWEKKLSEYAYSSRGGSIDIQTHSWIVGTAFKGRANFYGFLMDWAGNLRWIKPLNSWGDWVSLISQSGERVYFCSNRGYILGAKTYSGEIAWECNEWASQNRRISSPRGHGFSEMYELSSYLIVKGGSTIFLFDSETGKLLGKLEYPGKTIFLALHNETIFVIDATDNRIEGLRPKE